MTDTINVNIPSPFSSFKNWAIFLLLLAVLLLWFTRGCGSKPNPSITQNQQTNDSVAKLLAVVQESNIREGLLREDSIQQSATIKEKDAQLQQVQNRLDQANKTATQLANDVVDAHTNLDTAHFIHACDSLAFATVRDQHIKDSLKLATKLAMNARDAALANANEVKAELRSQIAGCKSALGLLQKTNSNLANALNPKNKVYIGLEGWTCPIASGIGPGIMYQSKDEKIFGIDGGIATTGGWWFGGKAYIKIQLHR